MSSRLSRGVWRSFVLGLVVAAGTAIVPLACSTGSPVDAVKRDGGPLISLGDADYLDAPAADGNKVTVDGGFAAPDGGVLRADRFVTSVVSFTPGDCAGFGIPEMPSIVMGPPVGGGCCSGSLDVVSLGHAGEIVLDFAPNAIIDGRGVDFIVFENPFWVGGDPSRPYAKLGEVSVSEDGTTWKSFPCTPGAGPVYGTCAGWRPVFSAPGNGISPVDSNAAGGDSFDLADLGLSAARFVRIRDLGTVACPTDPAMKSTSGGFNLDAIAIVNAKTP
jgi:hypothetical protein